MVEKKSSELDYQKALVDGAYSFAYRDLKSYKDNGPSLVSILRSKWSDKSKSLSIEQLQDRINCWSKPDFYRVWNLINTTDKKRKILTYKEVLLEECIHQKEHKTHYRQIKIKPVSISVSTTIKNPKNLYGDHDTP